MTTEPLELLRRANSTTTADGDRWATSEAGRAVHDAIVRSAAAPNHGPTDPHTNPDTDPPTDPPTELYARPAAATRGTARTHRIALAAAGVLLLVGIATGVAVLGGGRDGDVRADPPVTSVPDTDRTTSTALAAHDPSLCTLDRFPVLNGDSPPAPDASLQLVSGIVALRFGWPDDPARWFTVDLQGPSVLTGTVVPVETPDGTVEARATTEILSTGPVTTLRWTVDDRTVVVTGRVDTPAEVHGVAERVQLVSRSEFDAYLDGLGVENPCTQPGTDGGDPSAPTAAARSGSEAILAMPVDGDDCGSTAADAGWPTTMGPAPLDSGSCLLAARATGRAAHQDFTGRTGDGGALVTRYVLDTDGTVTVHRWIVDADGSARATETSCSPPDGTWVITIHGPIVVFGAEATYC